MARRMKLLAFLPALALAASATACATEVGGGEDTEAGGEVKLLNEGKLVTCTSLPYEPFQFQKGGEIVGFDVELVDLVANDLGVEQEIFDTPFEGIETGEAFNRGDCDLAAAAMTITDDRSKVMDFSDGYFDADQALLVPKGSDVKELSDMKGKVLAVQQGTTGEEYALKQKEEFGYKTKQYEDVALLQSAVKNRQVDAGINDNSVLFDFVDKNDDVEVTEEFPTGEEYGIAVQQGNKALLSKINDILKKAKDDGTYDKIYEKWFPNAPKE